MARCRKSFAIIAVMGFISFVGFIVGDVVSDGEGGAVPFSAKSVCAIFVMFLLHRFAPSYGNHLCLYPDDGSGWLSRR